MLVQAFVQHAVCHQFVLALPLQDSRYQAAVAVTQRAAVALMQRRTIWRNFGVRAATEWNAFDDETLNAAAELAKRRGTRRTVTEGLRRARDRLDPRRCRRVFECRGLGERPTRGERWEGRASLTSLNPQKL